MRILRHLGAWAVVLVLVGSVAAQSYTWTTFAGQLPQFGSDDGPGSRARFYFPDAIATDSAGNIFVSDTYNHTVRRITPEGVVTTVAGLAGQSGGADGVGAAARFNYPRGLTVDSAGNVFVADLENNTIRKITAAGVVSTVAGVAGQTGSADGPGASARFYSPVGVAVDREGNLFVADADNGTIRKISPDGMVSTFAGLARAYGSIDGTGGAARLNGPSGMALDSSGNLLVTDNSNHNIRKITPAGVVTTVAGFAGTSGSTDGTGSSARFNTPQGVAIDASDNLYIADTGNNLIRKITPGGVVSVFAGAGLAGSIDGTGSAARFLSPYGVAVDGEGNVFVADANNHTIRKVTPAAVVITVAGPGGTFGSADGTGDAARFNYPQALTLDGDGNLYVSDGYNYTIRRVTPAGVVSTFAGSTGNAGSVNGTGNAARFGFPGGICVDTAGNVFVVDQLYSAIRKITPAAAVTTFVGQPGVTGSADGAGSAARFNLPFGIGADRENNLYLADTYNHTIRKITPDGVVTTLAGLAGAIGSADGAGGASARFSFPIGLAVDGAGNVYVADLGNNVIRKITSAGVVTTVAGRAGFSGGADGTGSAARFSGPTGVAVDLAGNVYVAELLNSTVRRITAAGVVSTIGGAPGAYGGIEGVGSSARFGFPGMVAVNSSGVVYVGDASNNTIMRGVPDSMPVIVVQPQPLAVTPGTRVTLNVSATGGGLRYQWNFGGTAIPGATASTYTLASAQAANAGSYTVIVTNSAGSLASTAAALTVTSTTDTGRISNLAIRSQAGTGSQTLIVGLAVGGAGTSGTKPMLIRGVGPALGAFGVTGVLTDPKLEIYSSATGAKTDENDNWGGDPQVSAASNTVGAFSLGTGTSRDAALYLPAFPSGGYTVQISGAASNASGVALAEIYDASAAGSFTATTPRLVNVSARTEVGTGGEVLIAGFYIGGRTAKTVLLRAIGPTLSVFGVSGALADPKLELFNGTTKINENDNWGGEAELSAAFSRVGAFALSRTAKDAALLVTLAPGAYTAQISGVNRTTGIALVEVYEVP